MINYDEITQFMHREAYLLDHRRFEEWLDVMADSLIYRMPVRVTRDDNNAVDTVEDMAYFEETKRSLQTRIERLRTTSAWAENPASRTRHLITNVLIESQVSDDTVQVRSYFLVLRSRRDLVATEQLYGERVDTLQRIHGNLKICARTIYLDQSIIGMLNLSIFI